MLRVRDLSVEKAGTTICRVPKLDVSRGERVAIVSPNGSGKTTLLRVLSGLERAIRGECKLEPPMRRCVYVHQAPYLFRGSVLFNVRYGLLARKLARRDQLPTAYHWLDVFGVGHLARRRCSELSGGEQRRVALARAFATEAEMLLLDEPFAELDQVGTETVCRAIAEKPDATFLIASPVPLPTTLPVRTCSLPFPPH